MIEEGIKAFFATLKTRPEASAAIIGYQHSGIESALRLIKQGRRREAIKTLSNCLDAHAWYKELPYYIPTSPTHAAGGLPAGDKD